MRKALEIFREVWATFCLAWMVASLPVLRLPASALAARPARSSQAEPQNSNLPLSDDEKVLQLLNRITFGPRPGEVERARQMGIDGFLNEQLHPEKIDDSRVEARVAELPTLSMSTEELLESYPEPKQALPQAREDDRRRQSSPGGAPRQQPSNGKSQGMQGMQEMQGPQRIIMELAQEEVLRAIYSNRQLQEVMVQFWMNHFNIFAAKGADKWMTTSFERDTIRPRALGKFEDLLAATARSPAMLFYLDNWMSSTPDPTYAGNFRSRRSRPAPSGGRAFRASRPFGWGGWRRSGAPPNSQPRNRRPQNPKGKQTRRGLNENYGRELMELHTLGVNGGYTQRDVIEVARCLTGWTIDRPRQGGSFIFNPRLHDFGQKVVLGHKIRSGQGMKDGLQVLHILARHPSTARFISLKLCRRFVADEPPQALVDRASKTFLKTRGNIRALLKTILTSPEFYSQAAYRAKVKSPLELVASSMRALGAQTDASVPLLQLIARMGQPMFQYQAPTGFPDRAATWINSSALLMRMNFAMLLASNRIPGTQIDWKEFIPESGGAAVEMVLARLNQQLLEGSLGPETRAAILKELVGSHQPARGEDVNLHEPSNSRVNPNRDFGTLGPVGGATSNEPTRESISSVGALVLASPEFQRR